MRLAKAIVSGILTAALSVTALDSSFAISNLDGPAQAMRDSNNAFVQVMVRRGGGGARMSHGGRGNFAMHGGAHRNMHFNGNVNRNVNVNRNIHVHRGVGVAGGYRGGAYRGVWVGRTYRWAPGAAIAAGAAIGFVSYATALAWAPPPPQPGLCWYYRDASRRDGFWDSCP